MDREMFLASTLGELAECWLRIQCSGCSQVSYPSLKLLGARHGRGRQLGAVIARMRCSHCEAPPATACVVDSPVSGVVGARVETWRVELVP